MKNTCPAVKICPLRNMGCRRQPPDESCYQLIERLCSAAVDNCWTQQLAYQQTHEVLRDALVKVLAEKSRTPQHELISQMLSDTGYCGVRDMAAGAVYRWMRKEKIV